MTGKYSPVIRPVVAFTPIAAGLVALLAMTPLHAQLPTGPVCTPATNNPPVAEGDAATTYQPSKVTIDVLANDTDPDGDPLTIGSVTQPIKGSVVINDGKTITFTPAADFMGPVQFTYVVRDGQGGMAAATVNVEVKALVLALGFEEGAGTAVYDASGFDNHGAVSGATWTPEGRDGSALSFDGVDDLVTIGDSASLDLDHMTIAAWVKPTALGNWRSVAFKQSVTGLVYSLYADTGISSARSRYAPAGPGTFIRVGGYNHPAVRAADVPLNTWTHLAATYDGTRLRLFVNGIQAASYSVTGTLENSALPLYIGGNAFWGEFFKGTIDEVRVFNVALTADQILAVAIPIT